MGVQGELLLYDATIVTKYRNWLTLWIRVLKKQAVSHLAGQEIPTFDITMEPGMFTWGRHWTSSLAGSNYSSHLYFISLKFDSHITPISTSRSHE